MRINVGAMNINVHEARSSRLDVPARGLEVLVPASVHRYNEEPEVECFDPAITAMTWARFLDPE